jgi:hypothetical protein
MDKQGANSLSRSFDDMRGDPDSCLRRSTGGTAEMQIAEQVYGIAKTSPFATAQGTA